MQRSHETSGKIVPAPLTHVGLPTRGGVFGHFPRVASVRSGRVAGDVGGARGRVFGLVKVDFGEIVLFDFGKENFGPL